ncbi:nitroreductase family protein [Amycolatopsis sp. NPDC004368]
MAYPRTGRDRVDLAEAVRGRRTIRKFTSEPVPREVLERVIELGFWAPSAGDARSHAFVVVGGAKRKEIQDIVRAAMDDVRRLVEKEFAANRPLVDEIVDFYAGFGSAPVLILAYAGKFVDGEDDVASVSAAIQNVLLGAYAEGLGTAWTGLTTMCSAEISAAVGVADRTLVGILPIGHPRVLPGPRAQKEGEVRWLGL